MFNAEKTKNEIVAWIRDYFLKNGKDCGAVIGISGGKDSSIAAALCVETLGAARVYGVLMPEGGQSDIDAAYRLTDFLKIPYCVINIKPAVDAALTAIHSGGLAVAAAARVNLPPRVRMTVLYAVSAEKNGRVVNTCNLSEDYVGYSTKFGDAAGDFSPLSRLTATEVKAVGAALNLPRELVEKPPADGLTGKTDEEIFGFTYEVLDRYIRTGICADPAAKEKIDKRHKANLHKLLPMPCYEYGKEY